MALSLRSPTEILHLIDVVRNQPVLWNTKHEQYNSKEQAQIAWDAVCEATGLNLVDVMQTWKTLRCYYRKLLRRAEFKNIIPIWRYYGALGFLAVSFEGSYRCLTLHQTDSNIGNPESTTTFSNQKLTKIAHTRPPIIPNHLIKSSNSNIPSNANYKSTTTSNYPNTHNCSVKIMKLPLADEDKNKAIPIRTSPAGNSTQIRSHALSQPKAPAPPILTPCPAMSTDMQFGDFKYDSDDFLFFQSLLPYMERLTYVQKLRVRRQFTSKLIQEFENNL